MAEEKRFYDCEACEDKNCSICPNCGKNPAMRDATDSYRRGVKNGYYTSGFGPLHNPDGTLKRDPKTGQVVYGYHKPGD